MAATLDQLAALVRGRVVGDGNVPILGARPVGDAGPGDITFIENDRYAKKLVASPAAAAIVGPHFKSAATANPLPVIEVDDPISAFIAVRQHLGGGEKPRCVGVHPQSYVAPTAKVGEDVAVYPFVYVGEGAEIGDGSTLYPGVVVGEGCTLGRSVVIHPNAVLYPGVVLGDRVEVHAGTVLGSDGFGYRLLGGRHLKVPQTGRLEVGEDVEIGANCAIDRATFEATRIGAGTKIDNLVMIGHNNQVGRHNMLCAQVGIAGSCKTGDYVVMAGQAGVKDQMEIGDRAVIGAQAGVVRHVAPDQQLWGTPAIPARESFRRFQLVARLPELFRQFRELAAQVAKLSAAAAENSAAPGPEVPEA